MELKLYDNDGNEVDPRKIQIVVSGEGPKKDFFKNQIRVELDFNAMENLKDKVIPDPHGQSNN